MEKYIGQRAVIYCRVSSKGQVTNGSGLGSQENACRLYASRNGIEVVEVFRDDASGSLLERKGLEQLFSFVKKMQSKNPITVFLTEDINRFARDKYVHQVLKIRLKKLGLSFTTVNMSFDETPTGNFIEGSMANISEFYRLENRKRTIDRFAARLRDGFWPWAPPAGYKHIKSPEGGKVLVRNEPVASIIADGLNGFASGRFSSVSELTSRRKKIELGKNISPTRGGIGLSKSATHRMLRNKLYTGYIEMNKRAIHKKRDPDATKRDIPLRKGRHDPLITYETRLIIQDKLDGRNTHPKSTYSTNSDFPLRGYLCDEFGNMLTAAWSKGRNTKFPYYRFLAPSPHKGKSISAKIVHTRLEDLIGSLQPDKVVFKAFVDELESKLEIQDVWLAQSRKQRSGEITKMNVEIQLLAKKIVVLNNLDAIEACENEIYLLQQKQTAIQQKLDDAPLTVKKERLTVGLRYFADPKKIRIEASNQAKAKLIRVWFKEPLVLLKKENMITNRSNSSIYGMFQRFSAGENRELGLASSLLNLPDRDILGFPSPMQDEILEFVFRLEEYGKLMDVLSNGDENDISERD